MSEPWDCPKCGKPHSHGCHGHKRGHRNGEAGDPCGRSPVPGSTVCKLHGGRAPQVAKAGETRIVKQQVLAVLARIGTPDPVDPFGALLGQLALAAAWEQHLRGEVDALETLEARGIGGSVKAAVVIELWNEERDRVTKMAEVAIRSGIAEREVRIAEEQGALIAEVLRRAFDDPQLALSDDQKRISLQVAARALRLLPAA